MSWINKLEYLDQQLIIFLNGNNTIFLDYLMWFISKPIFGAGSEMIHILKKKNFEENKGFVYQEYYQGEKASFSMLCFKNIPEAFSF